MMWANIITLGRLLSTPFIAYLMITDTYLWAFWLTVGAGLTDILDGLVARLLKAPSTLGAYLDPIADKVLLTTLYIVFAFQQEIPLWVALLIVGRDLLILGGIAFLWQKKKKFNIHPSLISKLNTFFQILTSVFILANKAFFLGAHNVVYGLVVGTVMTTLLSAYSYVRTGFRLLKGEDAYVC